MATVLIHRQKSTYCTHLGVVDDVPHERREVRHRGLCPLVPLEGAVLGQGHEAVNAQGVAVVLGEVGSGAAPKRGDHYEERGKAE